MLKRELKIFKSLEFQIKKKKKKKKKLFHNFFFYLQKQKAIPI